MCSLLCRWITVIKLPLNCYFSFKYQQALYRYSLGCPALTIYLNMVHAYRHTQGLVQEHTHSPAWKASHQPDYGGKCFSFWIVWESRNYIPLTYLFRVGCVSHHTQPKTTAISPSEVEVTWCTGRVSTSLVCSALVWGISLLKAKVNFSYSLLTYFMLSKATTSMSNWIMEWHTVVYIILYLWFLIALLK